MGVDNGEIVGDVMLGLFVAKKIADRHETQKAAKAEGITFEEMKLREKAARYRAKASRPYMMFEERKQKKWNARANACDEQLARFEETRRKAAMGCDTKGYSSTLIFLPQTLPIYILLKT